MHLERFSMPYWTRFCKTFPYVSISITKTFEQGYEIRKPMLKNPFRLLNDTSSKLRYPLRVLVTTKLMRSTKLFAVMFIMMPKKRQSNLHGTQPQGFGKEQKTRVQSISA